MESNIQVLLDKIYEDGIAKSKSESQKILTYAKEEADRIISQAKKESERLLEKAKSDAKILRESTEADLVSAKNQTLHSLQSELSNLISKKTIDPSIKELSLDGEFIKQLILKITEHWLASGVAPKSIEVILPESRKDEWEKSLKSVISGKLDGLKLSSSGIKSGFQIIREDKGYRVDFTEDSLKQYFKTYLRQKTAEWLFEA